MLLVSDLRLIECTYSIISGQCCCSGGGGALGGVVVEVLSLELLPAKIPVS
jgi:hypothetical protein